MVRDKFFALGHLCQDGAKMEEKNTKVPDGIKMAIIMVFKFSFLEYTIILFITQYGHFAQLSIYEEKLAKIMINVAVHYRGMVCS